MVRLLLRRGAEVDVKNAEGTTPLQLALSKPTVDWTVLSLLLGKGAKIDRLRNENNYLDRSFFGGFLPQNYFVTRMLLASGAIPAQISTDTSPSASGSFDSDTHRLLFDFARLGSEKPKMIQPTKATCNNVALGLTPEGKVDMTSTPLGRLYGPIQISQSPSGEKYLGPFGQQSVSINFFKLPPHKNVRLHVTLFIVGSWDGNGGLGSGPDILDIQVPGSGTVLHSTFFNNNEEDAAELPFQSFPDPYPFAFHKGYNKATRIRSLGFKEEWDGRLNPRDAVYNLDLTFAHSADSIHVIFNGLTVSENGISNLTKDENWGIRSLVMSTD